ncbi:hypothetical protein BESB_010740 [Besnoitia besnoiti]|uniref:Uncharacterized protein n=1 Tax=Besnoitia besnoiti TaxID=94643 RepID=A0A2A9MR25_BESBE|nr:hypothetical protein BESB_010740 [Besnoitia besnoiti]PFH38732.1 hypothetical protein BESB_010740 [Besnoitia besnoiti]
MDEGNEQSNGSNMCRALVPEVVSASCQAPAGAAAGDSTGIMTVESSFAGVGKGRELPQGEDKDECNSVDADSEGGEDRNGREAGFRECDSSRTSEGRLYGFATAADGRREATQKELSCGEERLTDSTTRCPPGEMITGVEESGKSERDAQEERAPPANQGPVHRESSRASDGGPPGPQDCLAYGGECLLAEMQSRDNQEDDDGCESEEDDSYLADELAVEEAKRSEQVCSLQHTAPEEKDEIHRLLVVSGNATDVTPTPFLCNGDTSARRCHMPEAMFERNITRSTPSLSRVRESPTQSSSPIGETPSEHASDVLGNRHDGTLEQLQNPGIGGGPLPVCAASHAFRYIPNTAASPPFWPPLSPPTSDDENEGRASTAGVQGGLTDSAPPTAAGQDVSSLPESVAVSHGQSTNANEGAVDTRSADSQHAQSLETPELPVSSPPSQVEPRASVVEFAGCWGNAAYDAAPQSPGSADAELGAAQGGRWMPQEVAGQWPQWFLFSLWSYPAEATVLCGNPYLPFPLAQLALYSSPLPSVISQLYAAHPVYFPSPSLPPSSPPCTCPLSTCPYLAMPCSSAASFPRSYPVTAGRSGFSAQAAGQLASPWMRGIPWVWMRRGEEEGYFPYFLPHMYGNVSGRGPSAMPHCQAENAFFIPPLSERTLQASVPFWSPGAYAFAPSSAFSHTSASFPLLLLSYYLPSAPVSSLAASQFGRETEGGWTWGGSASQAEVRQLCGLPVDSDSSVLPPPALRAPAPSSLGERGSASVGLVRQENEMEGEISRGADERFAQQLTTEPVVAHVPPHAMASPRTCKRAAEPESRQPRRSRRTRHLLTVDEIRKADEEGEQSEWEEDKMIRDLVLSGRLADDDCHYPMEFGVGDVVYFSDYEHPDSDQEIEAPPGVLERQRHSERKGERSQEKRAARVTGQGIGGTSAHVRDPFAATATWFSLAREERRLAAVYRNKKRSEAATNQGRPSHRKRSLPTDPSGRKDTSLDDHSEEEGEGRSRARRERLKREQREEEASRRTDHLEGAEVETTLTGFYRRIMTEDDTESDDEDSDDFENSRRSHKTESRTREMLQAEHSAGPASSMKPAPDLSAAGELFIRALGMTFDVVCFHAPRGALTAFHCLGSPASAPSWYVGRLAYNFGCSDEAFTLAFIYIDRFLRASQSPSIMQMIDAIVFSRTPACDYQFPASFWPKVIASGASCRFGGTALARPTHIKGDLPGSLKGGSEIDRPPPKAGSGCGHGTEGKNVEPVGRSLQTDLVTLSAYNVHRLLLVALVVAIKYLDDTRFSDQTYARLGSLDPREVSRLETLFLSHIDFKLYVRPEEYRMHTRRILENLEALFVPLARPKKLRIFPDWWNPPLPPLSRREVREVRRLAAASPLTHSRASNETREGGGERTRDEPEEAIGATLQKEGAAERTQADAIAETESAKVFGAEDVMNRWTSEPHRPSTSKERTEPPRSFSFSTTMSRTSSASLRRSSTSLDSRFFAAAPGAEGVSSSHSSMAEGEKEPRESGESGIASRGERLPDAETAAPKGERMHGVQEPAGVRPLSSSPFSMVPSFPLAPSLLPSDSPDPTFRTSSAAALGCALASPPLQVPGKHIQGEVGSGIVGEPAMCKELLAPYGHVSPPCAVAVTSCVVLTPSLLEDGPVPASLGAGNKGESSRQTRHESLSTHGIRGTGNGVILETQSEGRKKETELVEDAQALTEDAQGERQQRGASREAHEERGAEQPPDHLCKASRDDVLFCSVAFPSSCPTETLVMCGEAAESYMPGATDDGQHDPFAYLLSESDAASSENESFTSLLSSPGTARFCEDAFSPSQTTHETHCIVDQAEESSFTPLPPASRPSAPPELASPPSASASTPTCTRDSFSLDSADPLLPAFHAVLAPEMRGGVDLDFLQALPEGKSIADVKSGLLPFLPTLASLNYFFMLFSSQPVKIAVIPATADVTAVLTDDRQRDDGAAPQQGLLFFTESASGTGGGCPLSKLLRLLTDHEEGEPSEEEKERRRKQDEEEELESRAAIGMIRYFEGLIFFVEGKGDPTHLPVKFPPAIILHFSNIANEAHRFERTTKENRDEETEMKQRGAEEHSTQIEWPFSQASEHCPPLRVCVGELSRTIPMFPNFEENDDCVQSCPAGASEQAEQEDLGDTSRIEPPGDGMKHFSTRKQKGSRNGEDREWTRGESESCIVLEMAHRAAECGGPIEDGISELTRETTRRQDRGEGESQGLHENPLSAEFPGRKRRKVKEELAPPAEREGSIQEAHEVQREVKPEARDRTVSVSALPEAQDAEAGTAERKEVVRRLLTLAGLAGLPPFAFEANDSVSLVFPFLPAAPPKLEPVKLVEGDAHDQQPRKEEAQRARQSAANRNGEPVPWRDTYVGMQLECLCALLTLQMLSRRLRKRRQQRIDELKPVLDRFTCGGKVTPDGQPGSPAFSAAQRAVTSAATTRANLRYRGVSISADQLIVAVSRAPPSGAPAALESSLSGLHSAAFLVSALSILLLPREEIPREQDHESTLPKELCKYLLSSTLQLIKENPSVFRGRDGWAAQLQHPLASALSPGGAVAARESDRVPSEEPLLSTFTQSSSPGDSLVASSDFPAFSAAPPLAAQSSVVSLSRRSSPSLVSSSRSSRSPTPDARSSSADDAGSVSPFLAFLGGCTAPASPRASPASTSLSRRTPRMKLPRLFRRHSAPSSSCHRGSGLAAVMRDGGDIMESVDEGEEDRERGRATSSFVR